MIAGFYFPFRVSKVRRNRNSPYLFSLASSKRVIHANVMTPRPDNTPSYPTVRTCAFVRNFHSTSTFYLSVCKQVTSARAHEDDSRAFSCSRFARVFKQESFTGEEINRCRKICLLRRTQRCNYWKIIIAIIFFFFLQINRWCWKKILWKKKVLTLFFMAEKFIIYEMLMFRFLFDT